jgi:hypothetical protein
MRLVAGIPRQLADAVEEVKGPIATGQRCQKTCNYWRQI